MDTILQNIAAAATGLDAILFSLLVAALLDTLSGIWAAAKTPGALNWQYIAEFVRSHILQKIVPIMLAVLAAVGVGGTDTAAGTALLATATASIAAYVASVVASISANLADAQAQTKGLPDSVQPQG